MAWAVTPELHVIPLEDFRVHDVSMNCWCKPQLDINDHRVTVHNSLDSRELYERGELKLH